MAESDDRDREAILARRRRFIALALGGLSTGCAPGKPKPTPTSTSTSTSTSTTSVNTSESDTSGSTSGSGDESTSTTGPKYDLAVETETGLDTSGSETGTPRPCLVPPGLLDD